MTKVIQVHIASEIKTGVLSYSVHQGCTEHLLSLAKMIRVHRNEAVHPAVAKVNRGKVFVALQTFPEACGSWTGLESGFLVENAQQIHVADLVPRRLMIAL